MYEVSVRANFSAAHSLRDYQGKCENLHGHNWAVEVAVSSKKLDKNGLLIDFTILKEKLNRILKKLDHTNLNKIPPFKKRNPTSENIAKYIFNMFKRDGLKPARVSVWESQNSCATYRDTV